MQALLDFIIRTFGLGAPPLVTPDPLVTSPKQGAQHLVAVRDGYKIQRLEVTPPALPSRRHAFDDVPSFAFFLLRHFPPGSTEILATPEKVVAASSAIFERDEVTCNLAKDPAWLVWARVNGTTLNQRDLYRFLNARREELDDQSVLSTLRALDVKFGGSATMKLTEKGGVAFTGTAKGVEVEGVLPTGFLVRVPVYLAQPERFTLDVDLIPALEDGKPAAFTVSLRNIDTVKQQAFEAELAKLRLLLGCVDDPTDRAAFVVSRGTLSLV